MSHHYLCIGGPADGEYVSMPDGCEHMKVCEMPEPATRAYSLECAAEPAVMPNVKDHNYNLAASKRHGFVWVHEGYKGEIR